MALARKLGALVFLLPLVVAATARAQPAAPVMLPPITIDGPSGAIQSLTGLSVSRDGTGGLVYLESVNGINHVFASPLTGGVFGSPVEVDSGFTTPSSQPVIAAGDGGLLLIAFINGGELYVVSRANPTAGFSAPQGLYAGAMNPSIALSIHSTGYLAFTAAAGSGFDVRDLYYNAGTWQLGAAPLNVTPADDAGTGPGAIDVAAAGDGEAVVAWGEAGHVFARRVWFAMVSSAVAQADVAAMDGFSEVTANTPTIGLGDNSSYADVGFRELFTNGSATISRVLSNRLVGSAFQGVYEADGQAFTGPQAAAPGVAMMQYGNGFITSELQGSNQVWATILGQNGAPSSAEQIDSLPNATPPDPTATIAGDYTGLIAWQHDPGVLSSPEIRTRFYTNATFGPEVVASDPTLGPTNAAQGLFAAGDHGGDVAIAYVQGLASAARIEVAQLVYPPGSFNVPSSTRYRTSLTPTLSWSAPRELWGPTSYSVALDGVAAGTTGTTSFTPTAPLAQGPHTLAITAVNVHGLTSAATPAHFFVDSLPPVGQLKLSGNERPGATLHLRVRYTDVRPGVPAGDTSGVATVLVNWGDRTTTSRIRVQTATHSYVRAGRYRMTITITDRAGNRTVLTKQIRISKKKKR